MASGQVYSPEEGEKRNNLLIWYTRLQYTHTTPFHMQKLSHKWRKTEKKMTLNEKEMAQSTNLHSPKDLS